MSNIKEIAQKFFCECCNYSTDRISNHSRHMVSKKHIKKSTGEETLNSEEQKPKTRKPRTPKTKKNVIESSTQTDTDDETDYSDVTIEYEFDIKNDDKIKEMYENQIKELREIYDKQINELKEENEMLKDDVELLQQEKEELRLEIVDLNERNSSTFDVSNDEKNENELKIKDDTIYDLKCQVQDLQEFIDDNIKNVKSKESAIKMVIDEPDIKIVIEEPVLKYVNREEDNYLTKENFESLNKENLSLTDELIKLEEELNSMKCKLSNLNVEKYTLENDDDNKNDKKKKSKKIKNNDSKNPMEIYKELCYDSKFNNKIMSNSYIDKSNKCEIVKMNILKSIDKEYYQVKPSKLYQQIFVSVVEEMNSRNIKFIKCVDVRRNKFVIHDGTEWKKYNENEFENMIKILMNHISNSFYNAISNTTDNIDIIEFMKMYKKSKEHFLSEEGSKSEIVLSLLNPLYDDTLNFTKTIINLCKKMCKDDNQKESISKKSHKKSSKKSYDVDSDSESESDSDSDDDDDDDDDD